METTCFLDERADDLRQLGVRRGGVLLVHSSLKSFGHVPGGEETIVAALLKALGPEGTLLMPALSYVTVNAETPVFNYRATPSCVGAITEHFRRRQGTIRSIHPTHSVCAYGPKALELLCDHAKDDTPCGPNSPFRRLRDCDGQLLFLGCGMNPNTSMHSVEELVEPPYLYAKERFSYHLVDQNGKKTEKPYLVHNFEGVCQRYDRMRDLLSAEVLKIGKVGLATSYLLEVGPMWDAALAAYKKDSMAFVEPDV